MSAAPIMALGHYDGAQTMAAIVRRARDADPDGTKGIARKANSNVRTVEGWCQGRALPGAIHLLRLMAADPIIQSEIRRLTAMQANLDPEFEAAVHTLMGTLARVKGAAA